MTRLSNWVGSILVSQQSSTSRRTMTATYSSNRITTAQMSGDVNYLSHSSTMLRSNTRTQTHAQFNTLPLPGQLHSNNTVQRGQISNNELFENGTASSPGTIHREIRKSPAATKKSIGDFFLQSNPVQLEGEIGGSTQITSTDITWSPLPPRRTTTAAAESLCVALFCDDDLDDMDNLMETKWKEPRLDSTTVTPRHTPLQPKVINSNMSPTCSTKQFHSLQQTHGQIELDYLEDEILEQQVTFREEENKHQTIDSTTILTSLECASEGGQQLRPYTNPRDTPTHHPTPLGGHSPARRRPKMSTSDLTLESIHDLNWLHMMEPDDQAVLEVHIIWSILTLMVVLLACYSLHHQPLTG